MKAAELAELLMRNPDSEVYVRVDRARACCAATSMSRVYDKRGSGLHAILIHGDGRIQTRTSHLQILEHIATD